MLFLSVVEQAIKDTMEPQPKIRQAAIDWLMHDRDGFLRVCECAGLDPDYLRKMLASRFADA